MVIWFILKHNLKRKQKTKTELIEKMSKNAGVAKIAANAALDLIIDGVTKHY